MGLRGRGLSWGGAEAGGRRAGLRSRFRARAESGAAWGRLEGRGMGLAFGRQPAPGIGTGFPARSLPTTPARGVCTCGAQTRACADGHLPRDTRIPPVVRGCAGKPCERAAHPRGPRVGSGTKARLPCMPPHAPASHAWTAGCAVSSHAWALPYPEYLQARPLSSPPMGTS